MRRRREVSLGATAIASTGGLPAPAIAQGVKELKLVTDWTDEMPGLRAGAERLAQSITASSEGRFNVIVNPANTLVHEFETFDAVSAGAPQTCTIRTTRISRASRRRSISLLRCLMA